MYAWDVGMGAKGGRRARRRRRRQSRDLAPSLAACRRSISIAEGVGVAPRGRHKWPTFTVTMHATSFHRHAQCHHRQAVLSDTRSCHTSTTIKYLNACTQPCHSSASVPARKMARTRAVSGLHTQAGSWGGWRKEEGELPKVHTGNLGLKWLTPTEWCSFVPDCDKWTCVWCGFKFDLGPYY